MLPVRVQATLTQQPIGQLNLKNLDNEINIDLNGAAQQTNNTPSTRQLTLYERATCATNSNASNDNEENKSWTPVNRQTTNRGKRNDRKIRQLIAVENLFAAPEPYFEKIVTIKFVGSNINTSLNVIKAYRDIKTQIGDPKRIVKSSKDSLLVETNNRQQTEKLLQVTTIASRQVQVEKHTYIITFEKQKLPRVLKLSSWHSELVVEYKERPRICNKCQRFSHIEKYCLKDAVTCARCGTDGHQKNAYPNSTRCFRCGEAHYANDRSCNKYLIEAEILATQVKEKTSRIEARLKVIDQHPEYDRLYSTVTAGEGSGEMEGRVTSGSNAQETTPHRYHPAPTLLSPSDLKMSKNPPMLMSSRLANRKITIVRTKPNYKGKPLQLMSTLILIMQ